MKMAPQALENKDIELLNPQSYENMAIIPLKSEGNYKLDILTLKKGFELGLVEVKECSTSTVNTIIVKNNAVTPLILIDGEEVVGGDQNRIVNATTVIAAKTEMKIPVSCTEKGRWAYKSEFEDSKYIANYNTRKAKEIASRSNSSSQAAVWESINKLEIENDYMSPTSAMEESYEQLKANHEEIIKQFKIADGQNGILIIINGEIKGFELFLNHDIYKKFHEKILKSYLIDSKIENTTFTINIDAAKSVIDNVFDSPFEKRDNHGLEEAFGFENDEGLGTLYTYENHIVHLSFFKKIDEKIDDDFSENVSQEMDI